VARAVAIRQHRFVVTPTMNPIAREETGRLDSGASTSTARQRAFEYGVPGTASGPIFSAGVWDRIADQYIAMPNVCRPAAGLPG